jgi:glycosyltransferase involved in cell wall biosynthesis
MGDDAGMIKNKRLVRITTIPMSLQKLLSGQMKFMVSKGFEVTMISSDSLDKEQIKREEDSEFVVVNMTRKISPIADIVSLWKLIVELRRIKPSIVHTHTPKAGLLGMMAAKITGVPVRLHTVAGLPLMEAKGLKRLMLNILERVAYGCATKVYPNSQILKDFIISSGFTNENKLKVIGNGSSNGINTEQFKLTPSIALKAEELAKALQLSDEHFTYIFIGRLVRDKGLEELVQSFTKLVTKYPEIRLLLVGPEEPELDPLSDECLMEIRNNHAIISVGYQTDVRPYLALSKVLVFPSYREGFPNVPMQAGCFNLPAIVTDINGCNEIIIEGENGLIIPVKDITALRNSMEKMFTDQIVYHKMVSNARKMITERYEQKLVWELILKEYKMHLNIN